MTQPNIVLILTDDQGYGDVGRHGNPVLRTPNMDSLHDESVRLDDFCVSPSCSPSRCALMTGRHEFRSGVTHTIYGRNRMSLKSTTLPELLRGAGYATGMFGKWHLGHEGPYRPEHRGFDIAITTVEDTQRSHFDPVLLRNGVEESREGFRTDILFDEATRFVEENREKPFFCYIPTYSPHKPCVAPREYLGRYEGRANGDEVPFFAMLSNIDDNIGRLMARLKDLDLDENTLVILMNDNGGTCGVDLWNAGMRGCKGTSWFGGTRALSFWRWPGTFEPREIGGLASHMDVLPTLAEIAGEDLTEGHRNDLDGMSLVEQLKSSGPELPDRMLFTHQGRWPTGEAARHKHAQCAVRWRQYHLVRSDVCDDPECKGECRVFRRSMTGATKVAYSRSKGQFHYATTPGRWALYDTREDPSQEDDLAQEHPEIVETMSAGYDEWWDEMLPIPVTHS